MSARAGTWLLVATVALVAVLHVHHYAAPFEDSYITYRYARNVATGHGIVYNAGERVEGCTSLAWTLALAVFSKAGAPLPGTATALSLLSAAALIVLTGRVAGRHAPRSGSVLLLGPGLVAANGTFAYFAGTGMETVFFSLVILWAVVLAAREDAASGVPLGAVLGLAAFTRPEGAGYAFVLLAALALTSDGRVLLRRAAPVFGTLFAALCAFRLAYFGDLLPNTYYAKASPGLALWGSGLEYVEEYLTFWGGLVAVAAFATLWRASRRRRFAWTPFHRFSASVCAASLLNAVAVGGDTFLFHRFLLPAVPLAAIAVAHVAQHWLEGFPARRAAVYTAALALVAWSAGAGFSARYSLARRGAPAFAALAADVATLNGQYFEVGAWLRQHLPRGTVIAVNAAGIVPYVSDLPTIDMLGLTDAHIARRPIPLGEHFHGHEKYDPDYVLDRAPDVIVPGLPVLSRTRVRLANLAAWYAPWAPYMPGDAHLLVNSRFGAAYALRVVQVRENGYLVFFVKKASALLRDVKSAP